MITIHRIKKELTDMNIRGLFTYVHELENENARLEESFQRATGAVAADALPRETVDRERFIDAANAIGSSPKLSDCDRMMLAVFVNKLEKRLFGGADDD